MDVGRIVKSHVQTTEHVPPICANCIHLNTDDGINCDRTWTRTGQLYLTGLLMTCNHHRRDPDA